MKKYKILPTPITLNLAPIFGRRECCGCGEEVSLGENVLIISWWIEDKNHFMWYCLSCVDKLEPVADRVRGLLNGEF